MKLAKNKFERLKMKTPIYWTHVTDELNTAVMAIACSNSGLCFPMTVDEHQNNALEFKTEKEAFFFINEINKPFYYENFGLDYELIHVERDSIEWKEVVVLYLATKELVEDLKDYIKLPWYKKLFHKMFRCHSIIKQKEKEYGK